MRSWNSKKFLKTTSKEKAAKEIGLFNNITDHGSQNWGYDERISIHAEMRSFAETLPWWENISRSPSWLIRWKITFKYEDILMVNETCFDEDFFQWFFSRSCKLSSCYFIMKTIAKLSLSCFHLTSQKTSLNLNLILLISFGFTVRRKNRWNIFHDKNEINNFSNIRKNGWGLVSI